MPLNNFRDKQNFRTATEAPRGGLMTQDSNLLTTQVDEVYQPADQGTQQPTGESGGGNRNIYIMLVVAAAILFYLKKRKK
jgi:hypothetical protein